jgi:hypothetical protein
LTVPDEARNHDWELLGLQPGADLAEVHRAFEKRKALYKQESMATYSLLGNEEQAQLMLRIEAAYQRILGSPQTTTIETPEPEEAPRVEPLPQGPVPDPTQEPGAYLRFHRLHRGVSLEQIAAETKIRPVMLQRVEAEEFGLLPSAVYVRGFVIQYAQFLGLEDPEGLARQFLAQREGTGSKP